MTVVHARWVRAAMTAFVLTAFGFASAMAQDPPPRPDRAAVSEPGWWAVHGVAADDVLNVRAQARPGAALVARIPPGAGGVRTTGASALYGDEVWTEVVYGGATGWVNARFLTPAAPPTTGRERRVAVVVGNAAYTGIAAPLANPVNDAALMAETLRELGFDVAEVRNAGRDAIMQALDTAAFAAAGAEAFVFYYAGHGLAIDGESHLVPVEDPAADIEAFLERLVSLGAVFDAMKAAGAASNMVILDACRDTPTITQAASDARARGGVDLVVTPGLGRVVADRNFLVLYATDPNNVASDGEEANSPFTAAFAARAREPEIEIHQMITRVRRDVVEATSGSQSPWLETAIEQDFYFIPRPDVRAEDFFGFYTAEHCSLRMTGEGFRVNTVMGESARFPQRADCAPRFEAGHVAPADVPGLALAHDMGVEGACSTDTDRAVERLVAAAGDRDVPYLRAFCADRPGWPVLFFLLDGQLVMADKRFDSGAYVYALSRRENR